MRHVTGVPKKGTRVTDVTDVRFPGRNAPDVIGTTRAPTKKLRARESGYTKSGPYNGWGRD